MRIISRSTIESIGRLLVIDDDLVQRTVIGKISARLGYDAVIASSFEIASGLLQREPFDMMTLDLSLGEHDGVELLRLVADCGLHALPIVIISGCEGRVMNSTRRVAEGLNLSVIACLGKPLNLDSLREALRTRPDCRLAARKSAPALDITAQRMAAGLARGEFSVELQPQIELATGRVVGAEALARWHAADIGVVSPAIFIPLAEQNGLMTELTDRVLDEALVQSRRLIERHAGFTIAVNISGSLMADLTLPERIEESLRKTGVAPHALIVEITETTAMADVDRAMDILVRLRLKNIGAAIDDFGTGYSSLTALARLPFSELKIDQSFVKGCEADDDMMKIVDASIGLARAFSMKVVAEGIDTPETRARLLFAGCDIGQGYLFAPSLPIDHEQNWLSYRDLSGVGRLAPADQLTRSAG